MAGQTLSYAQRYNPLRIQADDRTWSDTNRDNIAQENEIGPSNNLAFGLPVVLGACPIRTDSHREYDLETSLGIQHELMRGLSVSGSWFRRSTHNERRTDNLLVNIRRLHPGRRRQPAQRAKCSPRTTWTPAKRGQVDSIDVNSTDSAKRSRVYNGFEVGMSGRLHGASFFGGWTFDQLISVHVRHRRQPEQHSAVLRPACD